MKKPRFPKLEKQYNYWDIGMFGSIPLKDRAKLLFWFIGMHLYLCEKELEK